MDTPSVERLYADIDAALAERGVVLTPFDRAHEFTAADWGRRHKMKAETAEKCLMLLVEDGLLTVEKKRRHNYVVNAYRWIKQNDEDRPDNQPA